MVIRFLAQVGSGHSFRLVIQKTVSLIYAAVISIEVGQKVDRSRHQVVETVPGEVADIVMKEIKTGIVHSSGEVVR